MFVPRHIRCRVHLLGWSPILLIASLNLYFRWTYTLHHRIWSVPFLRDCWLHRSISHDPRPRLYETATRCWCIEYIRGTERSRKHRECCTRTGMSTVPAWAVHTKEHQIGMYNITNYRDWMTSSQPNSLIFSRNPSCLQPYQGILLDKELRIQ